MKSFADDYTDGLRRFGKHEPSNKLSDQEKSLIALHIESYHPAVSHYRREHAPLRRYLPPEITIRDMHQDFIAKYPGHKCSYEIYRTVVSSMKISFVKLGEEECELCLMHETHKNNNCTETACQSCSLWSDHMQAAQISRRHYQDDAERTVEDNEAVLSVDMQKVIMLPRMPGVKTPASSLVGLFASMRRLLHWVVQNDQWGNHLAYFGMKDCLVGMQKTS